MKGREIKMSCLSTKWQGLIVFVVLLAGLLLSACGTMPNAPSKGSKQSPSQKTAGKKYHKVRKGDTLYAVSWEAGYDYKTIAGWNGLHAPYTIYPGQVLRLSPPQIKKKKTTSSSRKKAKPPVNTVSTTKPKDTPVTSKTKKTTSVSGKKQTTVPDKVNLKWIWPVRGKLVGTYSSSDSSRDGIKIAGFRGQKIKAAEAGHVVYVGSGLVGYGRLIIVKHNNKYLSAYGHNSKLLVKEGDMVQKGESIAEMGLAHSGQATLHFEIRKFGKPVNPVSYLP